MPRTSVENITPEEIAALPDHHREILSRFNGGEEYQAIAAALNMPIGTVRSRLNRARGRILAARAAAALADATQAAA